MASMTAGSEQSTWAFVYYMAQDEEAPGAIARISLPVKQLWAVQTAGFQCHDGTSVLCQ